MVDRRDLIAGAVLLGVSAAPAGAAAVTTSAEAAPADESEELRNIRQELRDFRATWLSSVGTEVAAIRAQQYTFLKSTGRFPEFMDVGLEPWERVYDWHIRWQQPINVTRLAEGGYGLVFMFTTLVLRPNMQTNYIGPGYDAK
jgi:hypothetical protein